MRFFLKKNERGSTILLLAVSSTMITVFGFSVYRFMRSIQDYGFVKSSNARYQLSAASLREIIGRPDNCIEAFQGQRYLHTLKEVPVTMDDDVFNMKDFLPEVAGEIESKYFLTYA